MVLPTLIGIGVEEDALMREDEDFTWGYAEVLRCLWDIQVRWRVIWQV